MATTNCTRTLPSGLKAGLEILKDAGDSPHLALLLYHRESAADIVLAALYRRANPDMRKQIRSLAVTLDTVLSAMELA